MADAAGPRRAAPLFETMGSWPGVLGRLARRQDLEADEAAAALAEVLGGDATPAQIAAFVFGLRCKGETVEEMTGLVQAMLAAAETVVVEPMLADRLVDTCGTGGDRSGTINVSTIAALVLAGAGVPVCKHGGRASSSRAGSADVLETLGVAIDLGPAGVRRCIEEVGIGFCFAPRYHPAMRHAIPIRRELGVATAFNFLGPLANPARLGRQVVGVGDWTMATKVCGVLAANGARHVLVVYGSDGLDELTTTGPSTVVEWVADPGQPPSGLAAGAGPVGRTTTSVIDPAALGLA
ncbi:MAG: anthranilate phosphoribosyltransferase, partial [Actinomycetota bacterium]|nr:anthranilate phosphoribosyltransferase [Actinomycetota bacterium]